MPASPCRKFTTPVCVQADSEGDSTQLPPLMPAMQSALKVFNGLFDPALQLSKQVRALCCCRLALAARRQPDRTITSNVSCHDLLQGTLHLASAMLRLSPALSDPCLQGCSSQLSVWLLLTCQIPISCE